MNKLKNYLIRKHAEYKLKQLSKVSFIATNGYVTSWNETGEKTFGRFKMLETVYYAMIKVYGPNWNTMLMVNGFHFTENEDKIYLKVMTSKPGRLIGKMGTQIDELAKTLSLVFLKDVEIRIEETTVLYGLEYHEDY